MSKNLYHSETHKLRLFQTLILIYKYVMHTSYMNTSISQILFYSRPKVAVAF